MSRMLWVPVCIVLAAPDAAMALAAGETATARDAGRRGAVVINLGDYARGDGTDETDAIQRAFDALPPADLREKDTPMHHPGGVMIVPRPEKYYAISRTIRIEEKWNTVIRCENVVNASRGFGNVYYFHWIGPDNGTMFQFNSLSGLKIVNLSMNGMGTETLGRVAERFDTYGWKPESRLTRGVTGVLIGPEGRPRGRAVAMVFDQLTVANVSVGIRLGDHANNGPDIREITFRGTYINNFSEYGIVAASGNLANITFETLHTSGSPRPKHAILVNGGELLVVNWNGDSERKATMPEGSSEVHINAGGVQIIKAWSEWKGPFLTTGSGAPDRTEGSQSGANYPIILEGIRHYAGWMVPANGGTNPIPYSIIYDRPIPLHLIGCSLWGGVKLGAKSQATIIDHGTVFLNKDIGKGFTGEGVERFGRVIHLGTRSGQNARVLEPYVVDRRNTPGVGPPTQGTWRRGDAVVNIEPDPDTPAKAWKGWVCVKAGRPGQWAPFGALGKTVR